MPNLQTKTLGGKVWWVTLKEMPDGKKVQQHIITKHIRILDHNNRRVGWGWKN